MIISARSTVSLGTILKHLKDWELVGIGTGIEDGLEGKCISPETADVTGRGTVDQQQSWRKGGCGGGNVSSYSGDENHVRIWNQPLRGTSSGAYFITASFETLCVQLGVAMTSSTPKYKYQPNDFAPVSYFKVYSTQHPSQLWHCVDGSTNPDRTPSALKTDGYDRGANSFVDDLQAEAKVQGWDFLARSAPPALRRRAPQCAR